MKKISKKDKLKRYQEVLDFVIDNPQMERELAYGECPHHNNMVTCHICNESSQVMFNDLILGEFKVKRYSKQKRHRDYKRVLSELFLLEKESNYFLICHHLNWINGLDQDDISELPQYEEFYYFNDLKTDNFIWHQLKIANEDGWIWENAEAPNEFRIFILQLCIEMTK